MRIRGALHIHSTLSRDGTMTIADLVRWYSGKRYQFLALGEHAEDLDEAKVESLLEQSLENSSDRFCVIPGIEFAGRGDVHVLGIGASSLISETSPLNLIERIHEQGGFAVLAHPKRIGWAYPAEILRAADAVEIWNVGYDGKYLPPTQALRSFEHMRKTNDRLRAVASHDFHRIPSFYDVAVEMDVEQLSCPAILRNFEEARYEICSSLFRTDPRFNYPWAKRIALRLLSTQFATVRKVRSLLRPSL